MANLWGEIPIDAYIQTPKALLEQQAQELTTETRGLLEGFVELDKNRMRMSPNMSVRLMIRVPALNNYTYEVVSFSYPLVELYPCDVIDPGEGRFEANDADELQSLLEGTLKSDRVRRAIVGLISQARSES